MATQLAKQRAKAQQLLEVGIHGCGQRSSSNLRGLPTKQCELVNTHTSDTHSPPTPQAQTWPEDITYHSLGVFPNV
jgi:hypothetical protein